MPEIHDPFVAAPQWAGPDARLRIHEFADTRIVWIELGAGPPLLLLHGYGGSARWWVRNVNVLAKTHRVLVPDLPGFGRSHLWTRFTLDLAVDRLIGWLDSLGIASVDVMGHSMGGMFALLLASSHPDRVHSLLLIAPAGIPFNTSLAGIALNAFRSRSSGDPRFTPIVIAGSLRTGPRIMWQAVQQIRSVDIRPLLYAIKAPTLILWGEKDYLLPVKGAKIIASGIRGAELVVVPGAGHNLMYDQSDLVNAAATTFFARHGSSAP